MWTRGWRDRALSDLDRPWDVIIIGGGITGAGLLREATRAGLRALLLEAHDFASGTSSRSSKMVHGGLRYLKQGEIRLTFESVRERERLLKEGRGLVGQLGFLLPSFAGDHTPGWVFGAALLIYDLLALRWSLRHDWRNAPALRELCPPLGESGLRGGYRYFDAQTDDARLVLRVIREAVRAGGVALNYARAESLLRRRDHAVADRTVCGLAVRDQVSGRALEVQASAVINATGAWADDLRAFVGQPRRLRRLRGSHLVLPARRLPLRRAVGFLHPADGRAVFAVPWEGVTLCGTTDVDHAASLETDVSISGNELDYLLAALRHVFPSLALEESDVQATFAGVRPVVDTGKADPSQESREHVLWDEDGLLTVTGGKLTTFRRMAHAALRAIRTRLPDRPPGSVRLEHGQRMLDGLVESEIGLDLDPMLRLRLLGWYGADMPALINGAAPDELTPIGETPNVWAELRWAARAEGVVHLDDLLLRRVRLGLLLPNGGLDCLEPIRAIVQPELGWDDERWAHEAGDYARLWRQRYFLPER
jgi:glycerol-3-phosphate dehydrogenase